MSVKQSIDSQIDKLMSVINQHESLVGQLATATDPFIRDSLIRDMMDNSNRIRAIGNELDRLRYSL